MIKKTLFVGAAVLLLVALFAGRGMVSYVTTAVDKVEDQFKSNVPVKFEIERARRMIKDLAPEIERNMHLIAREEVEVAKLERELAQTENQLAKSQDEILRLKGDLESGNSHFVYAGRSYSAVRGQDGPGQSFPALQDSRGDRGSAEAGPASSGKRSPGRP